MEEDKLLRFHERLKDFLQKNLTKLLNLVLFFVIIIALSGAGFFIRKTRKKGPLKSSLRLFTSRVI